jgi:hypothetical protein
MISSRNWRSGRTRFERHGHRRATLKLGLVGLSVKRCGGVSVPPTARPKAGQARRQPTSASSSARESLGRPQSRARRRAGVGRA